MRPIYLIERLWYNQSPLLWLLWPFQIPFMLIVLAKRAVYQYGFLKTVSFQKPVLVVGNLSVGGTGKTPFITSLVKYLISQKLSVGIVSRGYKANLSAFPHQVTKDDTVDTVGDEAFMQFRKLNVPIVISPDRAQAVEFLIEHNPVDLVISDDGLQHYKMARDLEVVLYDGVRQFGNRLVLPFGPLREPMSRIRTVDYIIQNGKQNTRFTSQKAELKEISLVNLLTKDEKALDFLAEQEVVAVAGIGNPTRFFSSLENYANVKSKSIYPDHHAFKVTDFNLVHEDKIVVMTEKDAVKCEKFAKKNWYYLKVEMKLDESLLSDIEKRVKAEMNNV